MPEILLVEDDTALAGGVARAVAGEGRHVTVCAHRRRSAAGA